MTAAALTLILTAAVLHATWNLLVKKAGGGPEVLWIFTTIQTAVLLPVAVVVLILDGHMLSFTEAGFLFGTIVLHLAYFISLQRGYRSGDLSLVYPIARGLGPMLATLGAVAWLGERPSIQAVAGLLLVVTGVAVLTIQPGEEIKHPKAGVIYGVVTGILIACYTVWDKYAVHVLEIPPLVLEGFAGMGVSLLLSPYAIRQWPRTREVWRMHRAKILCIAAFAPLSYILVLTAMQFTNLSIVAPAREISILFAAILGTRFLGEGQTTRRLLAAAAMVGGLVALALG